MAENDYTKLASRIMNEDSYCGTQCQLRKNVAAARIAATTAPTKLARARKQYIEYTKGEEYYETLREKKLAAKAQRQADAMAAAFDEQVSAVETVGRAYDTQKASADYVTEFDWKLKREEGALQVDARDTQDDIVTSDRKSWYRLEHIESLEWRYSVLRFAYLVLTCCMIALYAVRKIKAGEKIVKVVAHIIGIGILFLWFLPFSNFPVLTAIWGWIRRVFSILYAWSPFKSGLV
jgi:hypothetical protein